MLQQILKKRLEIEKEQKKIDDEVRRMKEIAQKEFSEINEVISVLSKYVDFKTLSRRSI